MACDWIKMRVDLYRDPKVCVIADHLMAKNGELSRYVGQILQRDMTVTRNVTRNASVGALVTVWGVMRQRGDRIGDDLLCRGVSLSVIDDVSDMPGFGEAMSVVGWAISTDQGVVFPKFFSEYNVDPNEKKSSKAAERQRRYREKNRRDADVTRDVTRDVTVTHREEKRREENKDIKTPLSPPSDGGDPKGDETPPPKPKPKGKPKRGIPDGFCVTDEMRTWAASSAPGIDVDAETLKFLDYHAAKASAMADWFAAWRNWMRNALGFSQTRQTPKQSGAITLHSGFEFRDYGQSGPL